MLTCIKQTLCQILGNNPAKSVKVGCLGKLHMALESSISSPDSVVLPPHRPALDALKPYPPGKPTEEVQRELGLETVVKLASNENPYGPSPKAQEAFKNSASELHVYPEGGCHYLRQGLARKLQEDESSLFFGNGSDEILMLMTQALLEPGTSIVCTDWSFVRYRMGAQAMGATSRFVPVVNWQPDFPAMLKAVDESTRMVFIGSPDNPTGVGPQHQALLQFAEQLPESVLLVIDEAYYEFACDDPNYPDARLIREIHPATVNLRTFSKAYGLAGLRIGYGIGPAQLWNVVDRIRPPFNVNRPAQLAALAALDDHDHVRKTVQGNQEGMGFLLSLCAELGLTPVPSQANFLLVDMHRPAQPLYDALLRQGVIVRPMTMYGPQSFLRLSIGLPEENQALAQALRKVLEQFPSAGQ
jgi:histidinol-phosphate aminotransferase